MFEFTYKEGEHLEASIVFNNKTITARHSSHFTKHLDSNIYFFSNDITYDEFDFYDFIKDFTIEHIPNQVEFNIYSIYRNKIENPLQNVPYPFNTLSFLKIDDIFYTQVSSYVDDSGWNKKWAIEYYFLEFEKIINKFPSARIREEDDEEFSSGRLKLEIANAALSTIEEAFERALPIIDEIISKVENSLSGFNNILNIIEAWNVNKDNKDEEFWQKLFTNYPEIISQSFSYPIVFFSR